MRSYQDLQLDTALEVVRTGEPAEQLDAAAAFLSNIIESGTKVADLRKIGRTLLDWAVKGN